MISWNDVKLAIYNWAKAEARKIEGAEAYDFIWEDQSEHRPKEPYGTLKITAGPLPVGQDETRLVEGDFLNSGTREITLSVNTFKDMAFDVASFLMSGIERPIVQERFQLAEIALINRSSVRDLTRLQTQSFEKRFQFDVRFRLSENINDEEGTGFFNKVQLDNDINDTTQLIDPEEGA